MTIGYLDTRSFLTFVDDGKVPSSRRQTKSKGEMTMTTRQKREFWARTFTGFKVRVALESMGGDLEAFEKAYDATRRTAGPRAFTPEQVEAIRTFQGNGRNIENLASELGVKVPTARGLVARAVETGLI